MLPAELTAIIYGDVGRVEAGKVRKLYEIPSSMLANLDAKLIDTSEWGFKIKKFLQYRMNITTPDLELLATWHMKTQTENPYQISKKDEFSKVIAMFKTNYPEDEGPTHDVGLMSVAYLSLLGDKSDKRYDEIAFLRATIFLMCMSDNFFWEVQYYHILNLQRSQKSILRGGPFPNPNFQGHSINFARLEVVASMINAFNVSEQGERVPYDKKGSWVNDFYEYVKSKRPSELNNFIP